MISIFIGISALLAGMAVFNTVKIVIYIAVGVIGLAVIIRLIRWACK